MIAADSGSAVSGWVAKRVPVQVVNVVVVLVAAVGGGTTVLRPLSPRLEVDWFAALALYVAAIALFWRRSHPAPVFVLSVLVNMLHFYAARDNDAFVNDVSILFAAYALAAYGRGRATWILPAVAVVPLTLGWQWSGFGENSVFISLLNAALGVWAPWLLGDSMRGRRRYVAAVEAERRLEAERAVVEERNRIARELHDVVAHHVSVMGVQAGAARLAIDRDHERARRALGAIEATSRQAVEEMRRMLGVLRGPSGEAGTDPQRPERSAAADAPQPGLDHLAALVEQFRGVGLPLDITVDRRSDSAPPRALQLSAYRIVEQSLTNVLEHAGPVPTFVFVRIDTDAVDIAVQNDPPAAGHVTPPRPPGTSRGHGSVGMRERVTLFSGKLEQGPLPDGGYRVRARLMTVAT